MWARPRPIKGWECRQPNFSSCRRSPDVELHNLPSSLVLDFLNPLNPLCFTEPLSASIFRFNIQKANVRFFLLSTPSHLRASFRHPINLLPWEQTLLRRRSNLPKAQPQRSQANTQAVRHGTPNNPRHWHSGISRKDGGCGHCKENEALSQWRSQSTGESNKNNGRNKEQKV